MGYLERLGNKSHLISLGDLTGGRRLPTPRPDSRRDGWKTKREKGNHSGCLATLKMLRDPGWCAMAVADTAIYNCFISREIFETRFRLIGDHFLAPCIVNLLLDAASEAAGCR